MKSKKNHILIQARKEKGYTQEYVASLMKCAKTTISNWENGYSNPTLRDALLLSNIYGKDVQVLFLGQFVQETQIN
jgi:putative transcriptional regulator